MLTVVPDCPRSAKESFAANFDWSLLSSISLINGLQNGLGKNEKLLGNVVEFGPSKTEQLIGHPDTTASTNGKLTQFILRALILPMKPWKEIVVVFQSHQLFDE